MLFLSLNWLCLELLVACWQISSISYDVRDKLNRKVTEFQNLNFYKHFYPILMHFFFFTKCLYLWVAFELVQKISYFFLLLRNSILSPLKLWIWFLTFHGVMGPKFRNFTYLEDFLYVDCYWVKKGLLLTDWVSRCQLAAAISCYVQRRLFILQFLIVFIILYLNRKWIFTFYFYIQKMDFYHSIFKQKMDTRMEHQKKNMNLCTKWHYHWLSLEW